MYFSRLSSGLLAAGLLLHPELSIAAPTERRQTNPGSLISAIQSELSSLFAKYAGDLTQTLLNELLPTGGPYTITQNSPDALTRSAAITVKQLGFLYGPPIAGGPYYPTGPLGLAKTAQDVAGYQQDITPQLTNTVLDDTKATADVGQYDGLQTVEDYVKLYQGEWELTLPNGPVPGIETNYTNDLTFSMERLSISPYQVRRLPANYKLPFQVSSAIANKVCGATLSSLLSGGRLFYADYRNQAKLTPTLHYASNSDAYFCINTANGNFLPLAIRTNTGKGPIYTPEDTADDWLSAKIMYSADDFWFAQWNHLANTHEVVQIAYMAAIRQLSEDHPVEAILDRIMYEVFAVQPLAESVLFLPGGAVDRVFAYTGTSAQDFTTQRYNQGAGKFAANYFQQELQSRGLINSTHGPALQNFPFYEDASVIWNAQHAFMTSFVKSYYSSDAAVVADSEIQAWASEAQGPAKALNFPNIKSRATLIAVLTHFAHLASTAHHTVNTNELLSISSVFPFHTAALYRKPPTTKPANGTGINPAEYLPPFETVLDATTVAALFARPLFVNTNRTLLHMFDDSQMLANMNSQTRAAATTFKSTMTAFSNQVAARTFDSQGLSQGMPFVWQALDPNVAPYSVTT